MLLLFFFVIAASFVRAQDDAQKAFNEGVKLLKANKFSEAERKFSVAIKKGVAAQGLKMSYIYKGFSLNGQEKYDDAIVCFTKAIEIDPVDPASYTDRGIAYSYKKDYNNAVKDFQKVLKIDSIDKQAEAAYYYLGRISSLQVEFQQAISYLDILLKLVPTDYEGYFLR